MEGLSRMLCPSVDVPCRLLLSGLQVARVIGKSGILIKELREESGAVINILDKQLPVAFINRDERVLFVRGTIDQMRTALNGILRYAFGGSSAATGDDNEEFKRSVEVMIPEASCSHLIGEKGARISAIMEKTRCDLHVVREPISGLAEQKRVRVTGSFLKDVESGVVEVQELLLDLTRFGALTESHFDIKEGPTDPADLVPRQKGGGSGITVAILLPKDEVAWVIGKRGSKISKLRERARVGINDAESPPFPAQQVIVEVNGAPLKELINVLQMIIADLMVRAEASNTTRLLVPTEHFGAAMGTGGEVILRIAEQTGASLNQHPAERHFGSPCKLRILEVTGSEHERICAATAVYEAVEDAMFPSSNSTSNVESVSRTRELVNRQEDAATHKEQVAVKCTPLPSELNRSREPALLAPPQVHESQASRPNLAAQNQSVAPISSREPVADQKHSVAPMSSREQLQGATALSSSRETEERRSHNVQSPAPELVNRTLTENAIGTAFGSSSSSSTTPLQNAHAHQTCCDERKLDALPFFILLPSMYAAQILTGCGTCIAKQSGSELTFGTGPEGQALLRIIGSPLATAMACYLVQQTLWLHGLYSDAGGFSRC